MLRCHTPPQCRPAPGAPRRREPAPPAVVRCARGPQLSGLEASPAKVAAGGGGGGERRSLAERLRLGSLLEDGLSYKESFIVRCYEVGINKTATVETIANLLQVLPMLNQPMRYSTSTFQRFGFSYSAAQQDDNEANKRTDDGGDKSTGSKAETPNEANNTSRAEKAPEAGSKESMPRSNRRRGTKRTAFSDSDTEDLDLSKEDLVKLVREKEDLLKSKDEEIKDMKDKVLRSYAEMENIIARTKRESENSKKYAVQGFSKSLLDVADNLSRASSVVKESFSKIDTSNDSAEAVQLLKTLLEGVEMTEKQLGEAFKKFGVEKYDPQNEKFDPNRHYALFQIPDPSKPSGTVAAVVKVGYMLHDRVLRPAEVGVTEGGPTEEEPEEKSRKSD